MTESFGKMIEKLSSEDQSAALIEYLKHSVFLEDNDNKATIVCSGSFQAEYIKNEIKRINEYLNEILKKKVSLSVKIDKKLNAEYKAKESDSIQFEEVLIEEGKEHKEEKSVEADNNTLFTSDIKAAQKRANLSANYRFENFIIGQNNQFLFSAATTVATESGGKYNPFYIYGTVGIGKTHILQAIGNRFLEMHNKAKVLYVNATDFRAEFVDSIRQKKSDVFKSKYKSLDMLLLDDLQLLESSEETSKELFEIFQQLESKGKQMVFVSDKPPMELHNMEARLRNRFEKSLVISIEPPQFETRIAIIEHKLKELNTSMPTEIINFMANNITTDVRKIEGALKSYLMFKDLKMANLNLEDCIEQGIFNNYLTIKKSLKNLSVKDIIKIVADYYDISIDLLKGKDRSKYTSKVRHVAMYLVSEYSDKSTVEIGGEFNRDHASVIFARNKIREEIKAKSQIAREIELIMASL